MLFFSLLKSIVGSGFESATLLRICSYNRHMECVSVRGPQKICTNGIALFMSEVCVVVLPLHMFLCC